MNRALSDTYEVIKILKMGLICSGYYTSYGNNQLVMGMRRLIIKLLPCDLGYYHVKTITLRDILDLINEPTCLNLIVKDANLM